MQRSQLRKHRVGRSCRPPEVRKGTRPFDTERLSRFAPRRIVRIRQQFRSERKRATFGEAEVEGASRVQDGRRQRRVGRPPTFGGREEAVGESDGGGEEEAGEGAGPLKERVGEVGG